MDDILLCTSDPLLHKSMYAVLRDCGFRVDSAEQTAAAVRMVLGKGYRAVILDSHCLGLGAADGARIVERESVGTAVIVIGDGESASGIMTLERPPDLQEFREMIEMIRSDRKNERSVAEA